MPDSGEGVVQTGVDEFLELVKSSQKISIAQAAKELHVSLDVVQNWVDFLLEEGIIGVEYKFITPYIYLNEHSPQKLSRQQKDTLQLKEEFFQKAAQRNISLSRANMLWKKYVSENIATIKQEFSDKAKAKEFSAQKTENLWIRYKTELLRNQ